LSRLEAIIDDECGLVHIEMGRCRRIIQIGIALLGLQSLHRARGALVDGLGRTLQRLLDLLLLFLADEVLHLLLRRFRPLGLSAVRCLQPAHPSLIAFFLHLLVLVEQFLFELIVLLLIIRSFAA
jgi:hypothetical protein